MPTIVWSGNSQHPAPHIRTVVRIPNDPDNGAYLCPNDILLGGASITVPQGPFRHTENPRHRFEFCQRIVNSSWKVWARDVLPLLVPRKKWHAERRNVAVNDFVILADTVRGTWAVGRILSRRRWSSAKRGSQDFLRNIQASNHQDLLNLSCWRLSWMEWDFPIRGECDVTLIELIYFAINVFRLMFNHKKSTMVSPKVHFGPVVKWQGWNDFVSSMKDQDVLMQCTLVSKVIFMWTSSDKCKLLFLYFACRLTRFPFYFWP